MVFRFLVILGQEIQTENFLSAQSVDFSRFHTLLTFNKAFLTQLFL